MRSRRTKAFSLVETLAATALGSLLVLAILAVLPSIGRTRKELSRPAPARQTFESLTELLRWDLTHAREISPRPDGVALTGFGSLDPRTLLPRHRPVKIVYRLEDSDGHRSLVREQTSLDVRSNRNAWKEIVCDSVASIRFAPKATSAATKPATRPAAPAEVEVVLRSTDPREPEFREWVFLQ